MSPIYAAALVAVVILSGASVASADDPAAKSVGVHGQVLTPMRARPGGDDATPSLAQPAAVTGKVLEAIGAAGYTYVRVDTGTAQVWAAGPRVQVAVGDSVSFPQGMEMRGYHSKSLDRTFESLYFVESITVGDAQVAAAPAAVPPAAAPHPELPKGALSPGAAQKWHSGLADGTGSAQVDLGDISKAEGGYTVAEVFEAGAKLAGQEISLRGKVVKVTANTMGKNWLHVRDGSRSADGADDLTVTTVDMAAVGDTVLLRGAVAADKDFGFGYHYDLLVEDASITVQ